MRRTKIICTVGPASRDPKVIRRLMGTVDIFRINFSHGNRESHLEEIKIIRSEARRLSKTVAILQDLPGPKIRVGRMAGGSADLIRGSSVILTEEDVEGDPTRVPVTSPELLKSLKQGDILHLADGIIRLRVENADSGGVKCVVVAGGVLGSGKGVNAPGVKLKLEYPTTNDKAHLKFGIKNGVDFVAASFVRTSSDVSSVRRMIPSGGPLLVAKIEKREAVENFDQILAATDGVMVARGDLGVEARLETVPSIQKRIIRSCNQVGKPVIVATQMLVSMVNFPVPTRAEVTDVTSAVLDGADALMLSDETTVGMYPVEATRMLDRIAKTAEAILSSYALPLPESESTETGDAIAKAACRLADYVGAKAIVAPTQTGATAVRVAKYRPKQPIVAMCTDRRIARRLKIFRGVVPVMSRSAKSMDWLFGRADAAAEQLGLARKGDKVVVTSGTPGMMGTTNLIKVSMVGSRA